MAWRIAKSLQTLTSQIRALHPGTTVWSIGDAAHRASASDHNPNPQGVVCAIDVLGDAGLDLAAFAEALRADPHPCAKYVIHARKIASRISSWTWTPYTGSNPHLTHVHVSVGTGPDGSSAPPYDDTSPWNLELTGDDMVGLRKGDTGERVKHLQAMLRAAGHSPGEVDGVYGDSTAAAVLACRRSRGSAAATGDEITGWAAAQIHVAVVLRQSTP